MRRLIRLEILKLFTLLLALSAALKSFPALAYSSGNMTIINTEAARYSLMDRKFIFDYSNSRNEKMEVKNLNLLTPSMKSLAVSKKQTLADNKKNTYSPANLAKKTKSQNALKNNWSKFKKSSYPEILDETNLEVKAKLLP